MSRSWQPALEDALGVSVSSKQTLGGGDFAMAFRAELSCGQTIFVKTHSNPPTYFFSTEAAGLQWLRDTKTVRIPEVLAFSDDPPFLALEWIESGNSKDDAARDAEMGVALAELHQSPWKTFGRPDGRTTGSLAMQNPPCDKWSDFYANQRLLPLAEIARQRSALSEADCATLELIAGNLSVACISEDKPSLLHGDLWAGNRIADSSGCSWLIDPAAHGGHREFDLSMMLLFGGYSNECFAAYQENFPLKPGFTNRVALHQLAPLLVHAIKFGSSYKGAVRSAMVATRKYLEI